MFKKVTTYCLAFLITVGALDIYLNFSGAIPLSEYTFHEKIGLGYRTFENQVLFNEGFTIKSYHANALYGQNKSNENLLSFAFVGDSYVKSDQVFERHYFGNYFGQSLLPSKNFEILNYGYNGSNLMQMTTTYITQVKPKNPTCTFILLSNSDLMLKNTSDNLLPKIHFEQDSLTIDSNYSNQSKLSFQLNSSVKQISSLANMASTTLIHYQKNGLIKPFLGKFYFNNRSHKDISSSTIQPNKPPEIDMQEINKFALLLNQFNAKSCIFVNRTEVPFPPYFYALLNKKKIPIIELGTILKEMKTKGINPNYWKASNQTGHWNKQAHEAIGKYLSQEYKLIKNYN